MKTPKRIIAATLVVMLAVALAACAQQQPAEPEASSPNEPAIESTTPPGSETTESTPATPNAQSVSDPWGVVQAKCTVCHTIERVEQAQKDWNGWNSAVDHMVDNGARLTTDERTAVVDYLATRK